MAERVRRGFQYRYFHIPLLKKPENNNENHRHGKSRLPTNISPCRSTILISIFPRFGLLRALHEIDPSDRVPLPVKFCL